MSTPDFRTKFVLVGTSAIDLHKADGDGSAFIVINISENTVYLGNKDVTPASGFPLLPGDAFSTNIGPATILHGISAVGSNEVRVAVSER